MNLANARSASRARDVVLRKVLVVVQFSLSIILIIRTCVIHKQIEYIRYRKLGFNQENLIFMPMTGWVKQQYEAIKSELLRNVNIVSVTAVSNLPSFGRNRVTDHLIGKEKMRKSRF